MSKTSNFGNNLLLERLTNDEFVKILPHLSLEQYVLTQVFIPKKKWVPLLDVNLQISQIKCCLCNNHVRFEDVRAHLKHNDHLRLLRSTVKQFYHPFYTYGKIDIKLARGEDTSQDLRENALREVNINIKNFKQECVFAKHFSEAAEQRVRSVEEEQLIETNLDKKILNPEEMIVLVNLPFEDIEKLMFCAANNEWQAAFSCKKNLAKKTLFHCRICSVSCCGIESLNSHLYGHAHNLRQLELHALCYEHNSRVNKNCCIQFSSSFSFSVKDYAMNSYRNRERNEYESWVPKLHNEVAKKFRPLNELAVTMFACSEGSLNQRFTIEENDRFGSYESNDILGHVGVEYVLKIIKSETDRDPKFECALCEFVGDGNKMQRHILAYDHQKKYLDLHYCDTIKKYENLVGEPFYKELLAVLREIVHKVAIEIERHHSRSLPYTVSLADYKNRRRDLIADVYALLHASQIRGPSFSNVVSKEHIRYLKTSARQLASSETSDYPGYVLFTIPPKAKTYLNQISHDPVVRLREYSAKCKTNRPLRTSRSISPALDHAYNVTTTKGDSRFERSSHATVHRHRTRSRSPVQERARTFLRSSDGGFHLPSNQDIWNTYRREIALAANKIENAYESFRKNPESHPSYEDEWNSFWQRRKKELEREGYDHRCYNFQPEWVQYFKQRIEALFGEALHKSQVDIRCRLNIPLDAEEDCQRPAEATNHHTVHDRKRRSGKVDEDNIGFKQNSRERSADFRSYDQQNKRMFLEQRKEDLNSDKSQMVISKINDNHSNVIHVLRLMTALEDHLGSLGGKIMDLLSNALQLEKYYAGNINKFETRILTSDNCNLIETAMEKLKGILFAGLLDENKLSGFNRVIMCTTNLLKYAEKMGWRQENNLFDKKDFLNSDRSRAVREQLFDVGSSGSEGVAPKQPSGKPLSDTLMDLAKVPPRGSKQQHFGNHAKEHLEQPVCPPPPSLHEPSMNSNLLAGFRGQIPNSGLASFDTKLSLDEAHLSRTIRRDVPMQTEIGHFQRKIVNDGNNVYNNSFKNNNETRTNINSRTRNGTSSQFFSSKVIPKMGQTNAMYQGMDGDELNFFCE